MDVLNVVHRLDGLYEVAVGDHVLADVCLVAHEFEAHMLPAMMARAGYQGHTLNIVEEAATPGAPAPDAAAPASSKGKGG